MTEQDYKEKRAAVQQSGMPLDIQKYILTLLDKEFTNEDKWIPCSERLPNEEECQENDNRFVVTDGNRSYQRYFDYKEQQFVEPMHRNTFNTYYDRCVIAWQQLPEPYKSCTSATE